MASSTVRVLRPQSGSIHTFSFGKNFEGLLDTPANCVRAFHLVGVDVDDAEADVFCKGMAAEDFEQVETAIGHFEVKVING